MLRSLMLLAALGCHHESLTLPDGPDPHDARVDGATGDARSDASGDSGAPDASSACITTGDGALFSQCCPFAASCDQGLACYWTSANAPVPQQATSACMTPGAFALGGACDLSNNACASGAWCAADASSPQTGTCRRLCDPAASSCDVGQSCVHMPYCTTPGNCAPATDSQIGYCQ